MGRFYGRGNKIMVFGTAGVRDGELYLSEFAMNRVHRAAEAYLHGSFDRETGLILVSGGYSKELEKPPLQREARLMARYMVGQYGVPEENILIEDESTNIEENYTMSLARYPEFFEDVMKHDRRLGLVSHPFHLKRAVQVGSRVLNLCAGSWERELPTLQLDGKENEKAALARWREKEQAPQLLSADS